MTLRVAINGYGRIGRNFLRALYEDRAAGKFHDLQVVAINDIGSSESLVHLTRYDTTHGRYRGEVTLQSESSLDYLVIDGDAIPLYQFRKPSQCPWKALAVDVVLECTGMFRACNDARMHLEAGAKRVIIGAVGFDEVDATIIYGVNHLTLKPTDRIVSNASCTTHCIAPLLALFDAEWAIEGALMTEIHAYTSDQHLLDKTHRDLRRARAAAQNLIPTTSSSINAVQQVLPQLAGKVDGYSMRVPTINVAAVDLTFSLRHPVSVEAINERMRLAACEDYRGIIGYCYDQLVSSDYIHRPESAIYDATQTKVLGRMVKMTAWYDNEWGYTHRLLDLLSVMAGQNH